MLGDAHSLFELLSKPLRVVLRDTLETSATGGGSPISSADILPGWSLLIGESRGHHALEGLKAGHSSCISSVGVLPLRICSVRSQFERNGSATLIMVSTSSIDFAVLLR